MSINRTAVLYKAFSSSLLSKLVSFIYQLLSIPLLISMIGTHNFGLLAILMSMIGWINILSGGISPFVTKVISENKGLLEQQSVIAGSRTLLAFGSLVLTAIFLIIGQFLYKDNQELAIPTLILFVISVLTINFTVADSIRQGSMQQHINNLFMMCANITIIISIYFTYQIPLAEQILLPLAVTILYLPLLISKIINFLTLDKRFFVKGFYLPFKTNKLLFRKIYHFMLANLMIQLSVVIIKSFAIIYLGANDTLAAAKMEIIFRYLLISGTFFAAIQLPLWPLITEAKAKNDLLWLKKVKVWLGLGFLIYGLTNFVIMINFGLAIFELWLGKAVIFSQQEIVLAGSYFLVISIVQAPVIILMGLGAFSYMGRMLMAEALLFLTFILIGFIFSFRIDLSAVLAVMTSLRVVVFVFLFQRAYK
ncbi:oligosaccharide flippase family protein [Glaciecola sp. 2405UD65-10]|uniref:oligosaccharide flippase family protein n=1 Tax=Glaciecola sp. 2405UD65-10 TaxID=3397244 RepID=UPI003B58C133